MPTAQDDHQPQASDDGDEREGSAAAEAAVPASPFVCDTCVVKDDRRAVLDPASSTGEPRNAASGSATSGSATFGPEQAGSTDAGSSSTAVDEATLRCVKCRLEFSLFWS